MRRLPVIAALLLVGCPQGIEDTEIGTEATTDDVDAQTDGTDDEDTEVDTASGPIDLDRDGYPEGEDCDDREPLAFPGGDEVWDGVDNDCDGRVDGRGTFRGSLVLQATAIVEGQTQRRTADCQVQLDRQTVVVQFTVDCAVPNSDALAVQLLGNGLTIEPVDNVAIDGVWSGETEVASDAGWQATGTGRAVWNRDLDAVALTVQLDSASLRLSGVGDLTVSMDATR